jgi:hypothetical protein
MMQNGSGPKKRWDIVIGTPDPENCPVCRAHQGRPVAQVIPSEFFGPILVHELPLDSILRCPCPLCVQARSGAVEE